MLIDSNDPCAIAKPSARLIKLLIRAHRFHATLIGSPGVPFAALAKQEGVSRSYFTRLVRLSYLTPTSRKPSSTAISHPISRQTSCSPTHVCRWDGRSNAPCLALLEKLTRAGAWASRRGRRCPMTSVALRYWNIARQR